MLESRTIDQSCTLSTSHISDGSTTSRKTTRRFINSAIYVEKPLSTNASIENCSIMSYPNEDLEVKTKRCTCSVDEKSCPCHAHKYFDFASEENTARSTIPSKPENKNKISQYTENHDNKNHVIKKWIAKKDEHKKKKEIEAKMLMEAKIKEREALLEQERSNFRKWLLNKKKIEREAKEKKKKEIEEQQLKALEREKRQLESQLNFQLWLKKKEEEDLERKIKKQVELINNLERKGSQVRDNEKAFKEWLKNAKNKQKPAPLNRGLESLYSSTSVTFINPNPWNPIA